MRFLVAADGATYLALILLMLGLALVRTMAWSLIHGLSALLLLERRLDSSDPVLVEKVTGLFVALIGGGSANS